jgi:hypothetical protein
MMKKHLMTEIQPMITKDDLEECLQWERATHTINPQGHVLPITETSKTILVGEASTDFDTVKTLGFVPYRLKPVKTYTFDELRKEPGTYQMVESVHSRIIVHAGDCVQFLFGEHSQEVIGNFRFDATYRKVFE